MTTLIEKSILNERLEKSRSGIYTDTSENRRKHRVGQKYGSEKKEEEKPEKTDPNKMSPEQQLEAINKVIAAVNEGKLKLPPEKINTLVAKKTMAEEAVKQAKGEKKPEKKEEPNSDKNKEFDKKRDEMRSNYEKKMEEFENRIDDASNREERAKIRKERDEYQKQFTKDFQSLIDNERKELSGVKKEESKPEPKQEASGQVSEADKEDLREARKKYDKEADEIRSEIDKLYESDHPDAAKKRKELWNTLKEKTNKYDAETSRLKDEYEAEYKKLDEAEDKLYDQRQKEETSEEVKESYTRVKFEDVPNSGKVNLKKYLSGKRREKIDSQWKDAGKISDADLKKMEAGLVKKFNDSFDSSSKSQRAEDLYNIMKVKGELQKRGNETKKDGKTKSQENSKEKSMVMNISDDDLKVNSSLKSSSKR